jgi:glycosyltransferase involved in cell wall biosynthesis
VVAIEVPSYLAAADVGLSFIKRCISKIASSPTKNGEYLACGLPIVINAGIGDSDALVNDWKLGVLIEDFDAQHFDDAYTTLEKIIADPGAKTKARNAAEKLFDLNVIGANRYAELYERVLNS